MPGRGSAMCQWGGRGGIPEEACHWLGLVVDCSEFHLPAILPIRSTRGMLVVCGYGGKGGSLLKVHVVVTLR